MKKIYQITLNKLLIIIALGLTGCATNNAPPPMTSVVWEKAPVFCEFPEPAPKIPNKNLSIQELRDFANRRMDAYCALHDLFVKCIYSTTGGHTIIEPSSQCN